MTALGLYGGIFISFFKIGLFTIGGGYAMLPLIEREVVSRRRWLDSGEFLDCLAIAQSIPGPVAINASIFSGYRVKGFQGALTALLGVASPSFIVMIVVAAFFGGIKDDPDVVAVFTGVRPAVAALIAASVASLSAKAELNRWKIAVGLASAAAVWLAGLSPAWVVAALVAAGLILARSRTPRRKEQ